MNDEVYLSTEAISKIVSEENTGRRIRNGRVEFRYRCIQLCHGFGPCRYCNGQQVQWRRPSPSFGKFGMVRG